MKTQKQYLIRSRTTAAIIHSFFWGILWPIPLIFSYYFSIPRLSKLVTTGR